MFERVSDRAREALVAAHGSARACRHREVDASHVLVGLLRAADTRGCLALNRVGLAYSDVLAVVQEAAYPQADVQAGVPLALTAQALALLDGALRESLNREYDCVETVHLALACSHPDVSLSLQRFVAGREGAIRQAVVEVVRRSLLLDARLTVRRPPTRRDTFAARREALALANEVRRRRSQLKRELKAGHISLSAVLDRPPDLSGRHG